MRSSLTVKEWLKAMSRAELLQHCIQTVRYHLSHGIERSARGVYYDLVGKGIVPQDNEEERRVYRRIIDTIAKAKLSGNFPLEWLRDDLREVRHGNIFEANFDADYALEQAIEHLKVLPRITVHADRWYGQPRIPLLIVEKDTLVGTIREPCREAGIPWYVCRGYSSVTGMYSLAKYVRSVQQEAGWEPEVEVLYIGDHDPEGLNIPETVRDRMETIYDLKDWGTPPQVWSRVALTRRQAIDLGAPPMPVKLKSARAQGYIKEHGHQAWEVEAMPALQLQRELRAAIDDVFDEDVREEYTDMIPDARKEVISRLLAEGGELAARAFPEGAR